ncbi:hypothetical protein LCGC14_2561210, partial [marine sediment metagenome]
DRNFLETPERVARFYVEMFEPKTTEWATFPEDYNDFVLLKNHRVYSLCPHHLLPVELDVSIAYVPDGNVLGLSKLARLLDECNSGPLLQERFTKEVTERLKGLCPGIRGAACLIEGVHGCTKIRGVRTEAKFVTYHLEGLFREDPGMEERFFQLTRR